MALGLSKTRLSPIAVDFGVDSIKLLQVNLADPPQFVAAASVELPHAVRTDMGARGEFAVQAIKKLLAQQPFKGRHAVCSIPAYQTLIQNLQLNGTGQKEESLDDQVAGQLRQRLNVNPQRMVIRSIALDGDPVKGSHQEVVCMAASHDVVMRYVEIAKKTKLDVVAMQCEPLAIVQAFAHLYRRKTDAERTTAFIDIGAATTKLVITHGCAIVFAKAIHAGGDHFTHCYAKASGCEFAEARKQRNAQALGAQRQPVETGPQVDTGESANKPPRQSAAEPDGFALLDSQVPDTHTMTLTKPPPQAQATTKEDDLAISGDAFDCLLDELQLCLRYHQGLFPDRTVEKLVFLGGESRHAALCQKLARSLRVAAQLGDPLARLVRNGSASSPGIDLRTCQPGWAVPMGLCLSKIDQ